MSNPSFSITTSEIVDWLVEFCEEEGLTGSEVRQADFTKWLKSELTKEQLAVVQAHLSRIGGFAAVRDAAFDGAPTPSLKEKIVIKGRAKENRKKSISESQDDLFLGRLQESLIEIFSKKGKLIPFGYSVKVSKEKTKRVLVLMLSDLHFGSNLDPKEVPHKFGFEEEARSLASIIQRTCAFKMDYRKETELVVWIGGDIVKGSIHDPQAGLPMAEQVADAQWLISQAIRILASQFKAVRVYCSSGNHDRNSQRHKDRALDSKWDSHATVIYHAVKLALADFKNVKFFIPRTPHCEIEILGRRVYATHGDTDFVSGNPSKKVDVGQLEKQMTTINLAECQAGRKPYAAFCVGHVHQGLSMPLPAGHLVVNPALIPTDSYARGVGYPSSIPGQVLFESTEEHAVGDLRFLRVTPAILADKSLDKVIIPFTDF